MQLSEEDRRALAIKIMDWMTGLSKKGIKLHGIGVVIVSNGAELEMDTETMIQGCAECLSDSFQQTATRIRANDSSDCESKPELVN